jgi:hypothetical protein
MSINQLEAKELVEKHLLTQNLRGYRYEFVKVNFIEKKPEEFGVVFNVFTPKNAPIDGPAVFIVDKSTGNIRVL